MAVTNPESDPLYVEARELYARYGVLKAAIRNDAERTDLRDELGKIQVRYETIMRELGQNGDSELTPEATTFNFDVGRYKAHKPVVHHTDDGEGLVDRLFSGLKPRTVFSLLLLIFCGSTLYLMTDKTIGFFVVPSSSMEPTLIPDDKLVTFRKTTYRRGDVVVLDDPLEKGAFLVKRIVALGNDDVYIHDGKLLVNTKPVLEPYLNELIDYEFGPYRIPPDHVFVLGDNRNSSSDSHKWGRGVPIDTLIGEVRYIYSPWVRAGAVQSGIDEFSTAGL